MIVKLVMAIFRIGSFKPNGESLMIFLRLEIGIEFEKTGKPKGIEGFSKVCLILGRFYIGRLEIAQKPKIVVADELGNSQGND